MLFTSSSNSIAKLKAAADTLGWWPAAAPHRDINVGAVRLGRYAYWKGMSSPRVCSRDVTYLQKMIFDDDTVQVVKLVLKGAGVEATQGSCKLLAALVLIPNLDCVGSLHWN